jgi:hypothetical protein
MTEAQVENQEGEVEMKQDIEAIVSGQQALVASDREPNSLAMLMDPTQSSQAFKVAGFLSNSTIIPKDFQKQPANVFIALHLAHRLKMDPIMAMQKMYVVHGRPSFEAQFQIALVNASGRFKTPLKWKEVGKRGADDWGMIAYAVRQNGETCEGPAVTIALAKAEGWFGKDGSKWKSSPELMLHYRSASWFARVHCPDVILGMPTRDELEESVIDAVAEEKHPAAPEAPAPKQSTMNQVLDLLEKPTNGKKANAGENTRK